MSRVGNSTSPAMAGRPDAVHAWALVCGHSALVEAVRTLERELDEQAEARGLLLVSPPMFETYCAGDAHVPIPAAVPTCPEGALWVHAFALVGARNNVVGLRAAVPADAASPP